MAPPILDRPRAIPRACFDFLQRNEELVLFVYDDAFYPPRKHRRGNPVKGTLTAGYGHTGPELTSEMEVTQALAIQWLQADVEVARTRLGQRIGGIINELTDMQYAALLSFVFNLGANPTWTIWKRLCARSFDQVPLEMMKFVNQTQVVDGKKVLVKVNGLVKRRALEVQLWATAEPGSIATDPPSSVTRKAETPPTPADPVPPIKSGSIIATGASIVASVPIFAKQVIDAATPYTQSEWVQTSVAALAFVAASASVLALVLMWMHKRNLQL